MIVFHADLDNTLIYSYKHDIGRETHCVERYEGRDISFMTAASYRMLQQVAQHCLLVPTTTRTMEQYQRIDLGIPRPAYALVCNGGILLENGVVNEAWYQASLAMIQEAQEALAQAVTILEQDGDVCFAVRNIHDLFIFTKSNAPAATMARLQHALHTQPVDILQNGCKIYVVPKKLQKGIAVQRFRQKLHVEKVIAAGDSVFDISMLQAADIAFAPHTLQASLQQERHIIFAAEQELFSDCLLKHLHAYLHLPA